MSAALSSWSARHDAGKCDVGSVGGFSVGAVNDAFGMRVGGIDLASFAHAGPASFCRGGVAGLPGSSTSVRSAVASRPMFPVTFYRWRGTAVAGEVMT